MITLLLAIGLSFLPTEPDTVMGITCPDYPGCAVAHRPEIIRIVPVDSQMVRVPVWWVKDVMRRIEALETPPKLIQKYHFVPDSVSSLIPFGACPKCGGEMEFRQEPCDYSKTHPGEQCAVLHGGLVCPKCGGPR